MTERTTLSFRDRAQEVFEQSGREGFVEDFIEEASDDLRFMGMCEADQELWIKLVETSPEFLDTPPLFE